MDIFEIKLSGISGESYNKTPIYICGYASLGEKTYYISNGSINENATGFEVSYSHIANK